MIDFIERTGSMGVPKPFTMVDPQNATKLVNLHHGSSVDVEWVEGILIWTPWVPSRIPVFLCFVPKLSDLIVGLYSILCVPCVCLFMSPMISPWLFLHAPILAGSTFYIRLYTQLVNPLISPYTWLTVGQIDSPSKIGDVGQKFVILLAKSQMSGGWIPMLAILPIFAGQIRILAT